VIGLRLHCAGVQARAVGQCPIRVIQHRARKFALRLDVDIDVGCSRQSRKTKRRAFPAVEWSPCCLNKREWKDRLG